MAVKIHPTAVVSPRAEVGEGCHVGPFCTVGEEVRLGARVRLESHVVVDGRTEIGDDTHVFPFALTVGNHARCYGLNTLGMKRRDYPQATIEALHHAFRLLLSSKLNTTQALGRIRAEIKDSTEVEELVRFIETSKRGVVK